MDSEGFVKYLKQWAGVPHLECHRQGRPLKSYTFLPMPYAGSDIAQTTFHRFSLRHGLRPALPKPSVRARVGVWISDLIFTMCHTICMG